MFCYILKSLKNTHARRWENTFRLWKGWRQFIIVRVCFWVFVDYDLLESVVKAENTFCGDNQHANKLHSQRDIVNIIARIHRTSCLMELAFLTLIHRGVSHLLCADYTLLPWWWWTLRKKSFFLFFASWFNPTGKTSIIAQLTTYLFLLRKY